MRVDYAVQIKNGSRLSELVPAIAKALPGMLKSMNGIMKEVISLISEMNLGRDEGTYDSDTNTQVYNINNFGRSFQPSRGRGTNRGRRNSSQVKPKSTQGRPQCDHCTWLKKFLKIREVDTNHPTSACTRALPASVKSIIKRGPEESTEDESKR